MKTVEADISSWAQDGKGEYRKEEQILVVSDNV